jgi:hypothetical protein
MKAFTDYPFIILGDVEGQRAPIREVEVVDFDGNKYCTVIFEGVYGHIKAGYLYQTRGRCGEVDTIDIAKLGEV